jgi:CheY-like chemotaxis protein
MKALLIVDDSDDDLFMLRRSFGNLGVQTPIHVVSDGYEALAYLSGEGRYGDRQQYPLPTVLLVDLQLRGLSGLQVLEWIRSRPELQEVAVLVLTNSDFPENLKRAYALRATSYLIKPFTTAELDELVRRICTYWTLNRTSADMSPNQENFAAVT